MLVDAAVPLPPLDEHSFLVFWCQLIVILLVARAGGYVLRRLGQPRVIGELLAGVALGPSLLGRLWPTGFDWLFRSDEQQSGLILGLAWVGVVFLLGLTGAEIDLEALRRQGRAATAVTVGSLILPLATGALVASMLPSSFLGNEATRVVFVAFFAVAFAISSLPVAARILHDLGLSTTPVAQLSLGVATANDIVGWLLFGVVVGIHEAGTFSLGPIVVALVVVAALSGVVIRFGAQTLDLVGGVIERREGGPAAEASVIALTLIGVGTITHAVGIEIVIGAFVAGIAIGRSRFGDCEGFRSVEILTYGVFAPLFFAIAGIRVDLSELASTSVAIWSVVVVIAASLAKLVGSYLGGRLGRLTPREALGVGFTLNARGALEIVIATVGLSLGVIGSTAYTVIVVMALATTALAGPMLSITLAGKRRPV